MPRNITLPILAVLALCAGGSIPVLAAETVVPVSLVCSEVVNQVPTLYFSDAAYQSFGIELTGGVPGDVFTGELVITSSVAEGYGTFVIEGDSLVDLAGNSGSVITSGGTLYVEQPEEFPTATPTATSPATPVPTNTPFPTATPTPPATVSPTPEPRIVQRSNTWSDGQQLLFSVPLDVEPADAGTVFEPVLGQHDRLVWRVLTYSPNLRRYLEYGVDPNFPEIGPGRGFWLVLREPRRLSLTLSGYELLQSGEMTVPVGKGFNQFGSPFFFCVAFDALEFERDGERLGILKAARAGWVANQLWYLDTRLKRHRYDVAGFGSIQSIDPWVGYWIYAKKDLTLVIPPIACQGVSAVSMGSAQAVLGKSQPSSEVALMTRSGDLLDGRGTPLGSCGFGWDIARSLARWQEGYQVLDGYGGLHALVGAAPVVSEVEFEFDIARRLFPYGGGYYILDGFGGVHAGGGCPELPQAVCFEEDLARAIALVEVQDELRDPVEAEIDRMLPVPPPPGQPSEGSQLAYYLLDAYGRVYPVGGVPQRGYPELDGPVAVDLALTPQGDGYYVVDAYGHVYGFGNAPVFEGQTPLFDTPRIVRMIAVEGGYYLVDVSGRFYAAGEAVAEPLTVGVGLEVVRDVVLD